MYYRGRPWFWKGFALDWVTQPHTILLLSRLHFCESNLKYTLIYLNEINPYRQCCTALLPLVFLASPLTFLCPLFFLLLPFLFILLAPFSLWPLRPLALSSPAFHFPFPPSSSFFPFSSFTPSPWNMAANYYALGCQLNCLSGSCKLNQANLGAGGRPGNAEAR